MKLTCLKLHHFRGIKNASITVGSIAAFVGENNSGKSSALRALNAFFHPNDELKHFESLSHLYSNNSTAKISLTFSKDGSEVSPSFQRYFDKRGLVQIRASYKKGFKTIQYHILKNQKWEELPSSLFNELKSRIDFLFIPPNRDHSTILLTEHAILKKIVKEVITKHTAKVDRLSTHVKAAATKIEDSVFKKISKEIRGLYFLERDLDFSIRFPDDLDYRHVLHNFGLEIIDNDMRFSPEDCGSGIQSLTLIALYRYLARLRGTRYILAVEEPESNLHPHAQREIVDSLRSSVTTSNGEGVQVLLSTHSTVIVDELKHEEIILCRRRPDSRGFRIELNQVGSNFWQKNGLNEYQANNFFRLRNSDFFFSRHVIICEGTTDSATIDCLAKRSDIELNRYGVSKVLCGGIGSLHYPVVLLKELDIPFTAIVDKDLFFAYKNNDRLDESRNSIGFPSYAYESFKTKYINTINSLIPKREHEKLRKLLKANHSSAMAMLENFGVICFRWNLETDLMSSNVTANLMFDSLKLSGSDRTKQFALENREKEIKKAEHIVRVTEQLNTTNLPNSYKRIQRMLVGIKKGILEQQRAIAKASKSTNAVLTPTIDEVPNIDRIDNFDDLL